VTVIQQIWLPGAIVGPHEFTADELDLFRFSAVTWNAHRIHYDRPYAEAEGLPGLAVQAHLQGAWFARVARSIGGPTARLRTLSWTNRAPVVAGESVALTGTIEGTEEAPGGPLVSLALEERGSDGTEKARGSATVELRQ
jgi:hydroxyacyl-ACP dehydratase HTD2-like protein with hotdog domain